MPWSALPPHIDSPDEWTGKDDDDHWYTKWRKSVKGWFAFGPRATEKWARFREYPKVLFAWRGKGVWRYENDLMDAYSRGSRAFISFAPEGWYLSRVQYRAKWHIALQWPLFLHGHIGGWQFYVGFKRDADRVYWLAIYPGRVWK